jgi:hypothetical protein
MPSWSTYQSETDAARHAATTLAIPMKTIAHGTSLAVWAIPSPVVVGERFAIKAGAKSTTGCELAGRTIEVCDGSGDVASRGSLGLSPWPGTSALYWSELELTAPNEEGLASWSVRFAADELDLPHDGSSCTFTVVIARPARHVVTVTVTEQETSEPLDAVEVRLGPYGAATDAHGRADLKLPDGTYQLHIWKVGYEAPLRTVDVDRDLTVVVEAAKLPEEDPDAAWQM